MPSMRVFRLLVPLATILDLFDISKASSPQLDHLLPAGNLWTLGNFWTTNSGGWQPRRVMFFFLFFLSFHFLFFFFDREGQETRRF